MHWIESLTSVSPPGHVRGESWQLLACCRRLYSNPSILSMCVCVHARVSHATPIRYIVVCGCNMTKCKSLMCINILAFQFFTYPSPLCMHRTWYLSQSISHGCLTFCLLDLCFNRCSRMKKKKKWLHSLHNTKVLPSNRHKSVWAAWLLVQTESENVKRALLFSFFGGCGLGQVAKKHVDKIKHLHLKNVKKLCCFGYGCNSHLFLS